jgi:hypothetical protein
VIWSWVKYSWLVGHRVPVYDVHSSKKFRWIIQAVWTCAPSYVYEWNAENLFRTLACEKYVSVKILRSFCSQLRLILSVYCVFPNLWCRILLEKLIVTHLAKKLSAFCGTQRFITIFPTACHWSLSIFSQVNPLQSLSPCFLQASFNSILRTTSRSSKWFLHFRCTE